MSDGFTLEQLRTFVAVNEAGNFSAAARKLRRAQSAVSTTMANLEAQLGLTLWDRSTRVPTLTDHGRAMLAAAERVLGEADALRRVATSLGDGVEATVSLCVDALFPVPALVDLAVAFAAEYPDVDLRVHTETLSAVSARVLDRRATVGVATPHGDHPTLERRLLSPIRMLTVVSPSHPLARRRGRVETSALAGFVQIVLSERNELGVVDQAVLSPRTWRITDLETKRAMLLAGAGWGNLPEHAVCDDITAKRLVEIHPAAWGEGEHTLHLSIIHRRDMAFGPAHRWLASTLEALCARDAAASRAALAGRPKRKK